MEHGFRTVLIEDASRGVCPNGIAKIREEMIGKGIFLANADQVNVLPIFFFLMYFHTKGQKKTPQFLNAIVKRITVVFCRIKRKSN